MQSGKATTHDIKRRPIEPRNKIDLLSSTIPKPLDQEIHITLDQILLLPECLFGERGRQIPSLTGVIDVVGFPDPGSATGGHDIEIRVLCVSRFSRTTAIDLSHGRGGVERDAIGADADDRPVAVMDAFHVRYAGASEAGVDVRNFRRRGEERTWDFPQRVEEDVVDCTDQPVLRTC